MTASRFIEFGVRSIAVATGLDHTTVGLHLRALRAEKDPLVTLVEEARGTKGDLYMLTVPEELKTAAEDATWQKGKIHALRPGVPGTGAAGGVRLRSPGALPRAADHRDRAGHQALPVSRARSPGGPRRLEPGLHGTPAGPGQSWRRHR